MNVTALQDSSTIYAGVLGLIVFVSTLSLYQNFARNGTPVSLRVSVILAWFISFSAIFLIPVDLHELPYSKRGPLLSIWSVLYWIGFLLTWLVLPYIQTYQESGHFHWKLRLREAAVSHALYNATGGIVAIALMIYLSVHDGLAFSDTLQSFIAVSNTCGLLIYVVLLGYGLVEIPRRLWMIMDKGVSLKRLYLKSLNASIEHDSAMDNLKEISKCVDIMSEKANRHAHYDPTGELLGLGSYINILAESFPDTLASYKPLCLLESRLKSVKSSEPTMDTIVKLHRSAKAYHFEVERTNRLLDSLCLRIQSIEGDHLLEGRGYIPDETEISKWQKLLKWIYRAFSVICAGLSGVVLYSQVTIGAPKSYSLFYHICDFNSNEIQAQIFGTILLTYLCICTSFSLFNLKLSMFYHLQSNKGSNEGSLSQNAALLIRMSFPLGLNYFNIIRVSHSSYQHVIQANLVPVLSGIIYIILPATICIFSLATAFNVFGKLLRLFRVSNAIDEVLEDADIKEGRMIVAQRIRKKKRDFVDDLERELI